MNRTLKQLLFLFTFFFLTTNSLYSQVIDPDTGQVINEDLIEEESNEEISKEQKEENEIIDKLVKTKSRHKQFRLRTGFTKQYAGLDLNSIVDKSILVALDIPAFTLYEQLYIGISGNVAYTTPKKIITDNYDSDYIIVYGANLNINYSFKITDGLYIVPLIGYGYIGTYNLILEESEVDPTDPQIENPFSLLVDNYDTTYINYGVFLDFSFAINATGFGLTAGFTNFSKFTFGFQF